MHSTPQDEIENLLQETATLVETNMQQVRVIVFEMMISSDEIPSFMKLHRISNIFCNQIGKIDSVAYKHPNMRRSQIKSCIQLVQDSQESIDAVVASLNKHQKRDSEIVSLRSKVDEYDELFGKFSDDLLETLDRQAKEHAEVIKYKDAEIARLRVDEIPFVRNEKLVMQNENLRNENEKMRTNISDMQAKHHVQELDISKKETKIEMLEQTRSKLNEKLRVTIEEKEKLEKKLEESTKQPFNPMGFVNRR